MPTNDTDYTQSVELAYLALMKGETDEARRQFQHLAEHFGTLWIGRVARERLAAMDD